MAQFSKHSMNSFHVPGAAGILRKIETHYLSSESLQFGKVCSHIPRTRGSLVLVPYKKCGWKAGEWTTAGEAGETGWKRAFKDGWNLILQRKEL